MLKVVKKELPFLLAIVVSIFIIAFIFRQPTIAMWVGFIFASYSAIANDSIQTLGTFMSSNRHVRWWILWLFVGGLAVLTHGLGWIFDDGDVAFGRLTNIPEVSEFSFWQIFAPVILLILTRFKIPVSTTFLILSVFSNAKTIEQMIVKTFLGYIVAFFAAIIIWSIITKIFGDFLKKKISKHLELKWQVAQWISTAFLWVSWLMQDTANLAVFLPRTLSKGQLVLFLLIVFSLIGLIFYRRGGRIQEIVTEKKDIHDVRATSLINVVFAFILIYFKEINTLPMSTTWVFLGLLAGRELVLSHLDHFTGAYQKTLKLIFKDIGLATVGLVVSIVMAMLIG